MLNLGVIEDTGRIDADAAPDWLPFDAQGNIVVDAAQGIVLCKRDVREVQLAKGAIAAGIDVLLAQAGLRYEQIERVLLAGGFGSYMDKHNAARIGLIPPQLADRTAAIGNAAGEGAKAVLINRGARDLAERLARDTRYIELSGRADFQDAFMDKMLFA